MLKRIVIMIMFTTLFLTACSGSIEKNIIGGWKVVNDEEVEAYWGFDEERLLARESSDDDPESIEYILTETADDNFVLEIIDPSNGEKEFMFEGFFENKDTIEPIENPDGEFGIIRVDNMAEEIEKEKEKEAKAEAKREKEEEEERAKREKEAKEKAEAAKLHEGDFATELFFNSLDYDHEDEDEGVVTLSKLKGKKVILNFWLTDNPELDSNLDVLKEIYEDVTILPVYLSHQDEGNGSVIYDKSEAYP